ncbi:hypothetical protein B0A52_06066 [Exophiala mesophila]|uniref:FAD/NAD(P)-binding domain-containing protein n=1 Tax=Exophiala mesophila TaxID=212818 RepID=A0A438N5B4_EXOME|nr:hypothetical protein B0A52_06066 [Exophiala mesophila]
MLDYIVIGAGPSGLCAAKTILECEPDAQLKILDGNKSLGGVWAQENLFPGLKTNNVRNRIDFSDFYMDDGFGIKPGQHVTGEVMHRYLQEYAERADLISRISLGSKVLEVSRDPSGVGWVVRLDREADGTLQSRKLIVAVGATNVPHRPSIRGAETFNRPIIHSGELGKRGDVLTATSSTESVAVLGGGKSAYDAVYFAASKGRTVEWIIRKSGKGPEWVFPSHTYLGPFKALREQLPSRRIVSVFSPCLWNDGMRYLRAFLHFTTLGKKIAQKFWTNIHVKTLGDCGMRNDEKTKVLEPETGPFWYGTASGVLSYDQDFYGLLKSGQVRVHREDISHLSEGQINLLNGQALNVDVLVTATGFSAKPTLQFTPTSSHADLGVPSTSFTQEQHEFWSALHKAADAQIAASFPRLLIGPHLSPSSNTPQPVRPYDPSLYPELNYTPFQLYRGIAPPGPTSRGDNSLVFISMFSNLANTSRCELQCLWAYAYLNDKLDIDRSSVFEDTALMSRYVRHRAPYGHGRFIPDLVFDQLPYMDTLLQDLKLRYWRKSNVFAEIFAPYTSTDYKGVVKEWALANLPTSKAATSETTPLLK